MATKRIQDFVEDLRFEGLRSPLAKGTNVMFKLPKALQYEVEGNKVEVGEGIVVSREEGDYTILYNNEELKVKAGDLYETVLTAEQMRVYDTVLYSETITLGDINQSTNLKNSMLPEMANNKFKKLIDSIQQLGEDGAEVVCFLSDSKEVLQKKSIEPIEYKNMYFCAYLK